MAISEDQEPVVSQLSSEEWERLPSAQTKPGSIWDDIIKQLAEGQIIQLGFSDPTKIRGAKVALGKRSKAQGLTLQFRQIQNGKTALAVRAMHLTTQEPTTQESTAPTGEPESKPRGRPRKTK